MLTGWNILVAQQQRIKHFNACAAVRISFSPYSNSAPSILACRVACCQEKLEKCSFGNSKILLIALISSHGSNSKNLSFFCNFRELLVL
jgi:hypothetical protein